MRPAADGRKRRGACGTRPLGERGGSAVLAVDVGLGTTDILLTIAGEPLENAVRLVVPSRTQVVGRQIDAATEARRTVVFTGPLMGGGASGSAMKRHIAAGLRFIAGHSAALTFADDLDRIRGLGVEVLGDDEAEALAASPGDAVVVRAGDLDPTALQETLRTLGVDACIQTACIAAQDHGFSPHGSNRAFRFAQWERLVAADRPLTDLFYLRSSIPVELTRLRAAAGLAARLSAADEVLASDTGPAALYGALEDGVADGVLVNVGNGHVVCAVAREGRLAGVFEHHTPALDGPALDTLLRRFLAGELGTDEVREDGGHGAVLARGASGDAASQPIIVTGPRRELLRESRLRLTFAAPHGDMMLTGCYGLLRAATERGLA